MTLRFPYFLRRLCAWIAYWPDKSPAFEPDSSLIVLEFGPTIPAELVISLTAAQVALVVNRHGGLSDETMAALAAAFDSTSAPPD